jgi:hypothetical protein
MNSELEAIHRVTLVVGVDGSLLTRDRAPRLSEILPPALCYGGGRCRGVMVVADGIHDLRAT